MDNGKTSSPGEFDRRFDVGESALEYLDLSSAPHPNQETKRVNVDMPRHMIMSLDVQAKRRGVTRQALIKMWLADRLDSAA